MLRPNSRRCRTASIRSGRAGGLAGELAAVFGEGSVGCTSDPPLWPIRLHVLSGMLQQQFLPEPPFGGIVLPGALFGVPVDHLSWSLPLG
jgi:hypothetical protein